MGVVSPPPPLPAELTLFLVAALAATDFYTRLKLKVYMRSSDLVVSSEFCEAIDESLPPRTVLETFERERRILTDFRSFS